MPGLCGCAAGTAVVVQSRAGGACGLRLERWRAPAPGEPAASGAGADAAGAAWAPCAAHAMSAGAEDADAAAPVCFAADGSLAAVGRGALLAGDGLQVCGRVCWAPQARFFRSLSCRYCKVFCAQCCGLPLMLARAKNVGARAVLMMPRLPAAVPSTGGKRCTRTHAATANPRIFTQFNHLSL